MFVDTIVICTMTALVILCSGIGIPYGVDMGVALTSDAFCLVFGNWVSILIALFLALFAIATILGWGLYGVRCAQYLLGEGVGNHFAWLQGGAIIIGALLGTGTIWTIAEIVNGMMMIPNLIAIAYLTPEILRLIQNYQA